MIEILSSNHFTHVKIDSLKKTEITFQYSKPGRVIATHKWKGNILGGRTCGSNRNPKSLYMLHWHHLKISPKIIQESPILSNGAGKMRMM